MSLVVYLGCWLAYLVSAAVLYRVFLSPHLPVWFPNSERVTRVALLVMLFSPTLLTEGGQLSLAPALLMLFMQVLAKAPLGIVKALLPWLLFGGLALIIDAGRLRREARRRDEPV